MKGLFFSQRAFITDLPVQSLSLCQKLVQEFDIDFLYGTPAVRVPFIAPRFQFMIMPPVNFSLDSEPNREEQKEQHQKRLAYLEKEVNGFYDFFITEIYPFGKLFLRDEVNFLMERLKKINPRCRMICSLPDVVDVRKPSRHKKALAIISERYDAIFMHSDPTVIKLEDSFPDASIIAEKVTYTGFVPNRLEDSPVAMRQKKILVPISTHFFGELFVRAIIPATLYFPDYTFLFVLPQNHPAFLEPFIKMWSSQHPQTQIEIVPYKRGLEGLLRSCALSISLANAHLIDVIDTQTPGIGFAAGNPMQLLRLQRFSEKGLIKMMTPNDLPVEALRNLIEEALKTPIVEHSVNTEGAEHSLCELKKLLF